MIVYQTNLDGVLVGTTEADESPLEPGVFHLPGGCVFEPPPPFDEGMRARWADEAWLVEPIPSAPEPEPGEEPDPLDAYRLAIQWHIDATARARNYDSGITCASYVSSTVAAWAAEAAAFVAWRDAVWLYAYGEMDKVTNGERPQPGVADLLAELPAMSWPAA